MVRYLIQLNLKSIPLPSPILRLQFHQCSFLFLLLLYIFSKLMPGQGPLHPPEIIFAILNFHFWRLCLPRIYKFFSFRGCNIIHTLSEHSLSFLMHPLSWLIFSHYCSNFLQKAFPMYPRIFLKVLKVLQFQTWFRIMESFSMVA